MDIVEHSKDWIEFDAETDEVPFLHMHDLIKVKYKNGYQSPPVPAWSVDFDGSRYPVTAYRVVKKADVNEKERLREALRFYAEWGIDAPAVDAIIEEDRGDKARAALNIVLANLENGDY